MARYRNIIEEQINTNFQIIKEPVKKDYVPKGCYKLIRAVIQGCFTKNWKSDADKRINRHFARHGKMIEIWCNLSGYDKNRVVKATLENNK